jgi:hypothetical protein
VNSGGVMGPRTLLCLLLGVALSATAGPQPVGEVVYATGQASVAQGKTRQVASAGLKVYEGDLLRTGGDGFLYVRMHDGGFFILRPASEGQVRRYTPEGAGSAAQFVLQLDKGVGRVVTGARVRAMPDRFRLNTPVAAIGVRGTDFTVQTDAVLTRAWVEAGRIVLAAFGEGCAPAALGPCLEAPHLELAPTGVSAAEVGAGLAAPRPLPPELRLPPIPPGPKEPQKEPLNGRVTPAELQLAEVGPADEVRSVRWGRWQVLADASPPIDLQALLDKGGQLLAIGPVHALVRERPAGPLPLEGRASFTLKEHEGWYLDQQGRPLGPAQAGSARLELDFAQRRFATELVLSGAGQPATTLSAQGHVSPDGRFISDTLSTSHVDGALGGSRGQEAGYLYQRRIADDTLVSGATYWRR